MMKIAVNGGHCPGKDPGALGAHDTEAAVCRRIMEQSALMLRDAGHEVLSVQGNELEAIVGASDGFGADVFVSIHCNAVENPAAHGTEVFAVSAAGKELARCMLERLTGLMGTTSRGVKDGGGLYVIRRTQAVAVLVETAFITNEQEESLLLVRPESFAAAMVLGLQDFIGA